MALTTRAQNNAVNFTTSQPIPLFFSPDPGESYEHAPYFGGGGACNGLWPAQFHHSSKKDFLSTCGFSHNGDQQWAITALLNQGNDMYKVVDDTAAENACQAPLLAADLNGDGLSDLVMTSCPGYQGNTTTFSVQLSSSAADGTFDAPVYYTITNGNQNTFITAAVAGNFEGNGRLDLAFIASGPSLAIFHNNGSGRFTQVASYALNTNAGNPILVAGDLNGDHKTDLVVVYPTANGTVVPYLSEGNGKFTKGGTYNAGPNPVSAIIGNFNDDAYGDIAIATSAGVRVLIGNSSARFTTSKSTPYPSPSSRSFFGFAGLVAADFDKDGKLDLAITSSGGNGNQTDIYLFWGAGNGTFSSSSAYSLPVYPIGLVSTSVNNNGRPDLAVAGNDGSINILYNVASRNFRGTPITHSPYSTGIVAADFNGDGKKDVAVITTQPCTPPCNQSVTVFPGEGTYFGAGKPYTIGMHGQAIAVGDLNGDGVPDLVVTNATPGDNADTSILLGIKGGGFRPAHNITLGSLSNHAFLVDVNGDGKLDLVEDGGVALGDGKGDFGNLTPFTDGIGFNAGADFAVADFNGDGSPDVFALFTPSGGSTQADVLINDGKGNFTATPVTPPNGFDFGNTAAVAAGRLTRGGPNDIVLAYFSPTPDLVAEDIDTYLFLNDGRGNFQVTDGPAVLLGSNAYSLATMTIADFNHDGYPDLGISVENELFVSTGPAFNSPVQAQGFVAGYPTNYPGSFAVADFNNDGWPDVVFTTSYGISRLYNVPVPMVTPGVLTFSGAGTQKVTIKTRLKLLKPSRPAFLRHLPAARHRSGSPRTPAELLPPEPPAPSSSSTAMQTPTAQLCMSARTDSSSPQSRSPEVRS